MVNFKYNDKFGGHDDVFFPPKIMLCRKSRVYPCIDLIQDWSVAMLTINNKKTGSFSNA